MRDQLIVILNTHCTLNKHKADLLNVHKSVDVILDSTLAAVRGVLACIQRYLYIFKNIRVRITSKISHFLRPVMQVKAIQVRSRISIPLSK